MSQPWISEMGCVAGPYVSYTVCCLPAAGWLASQARNHGSMWQVSAFVQSLSSRLRKDYALRRSQRPPLAGCVRLDSRPANHYRCVQSHMSRLNWDWRPLHLMAFAPLWFITTAARQSVSQSVAHGSRHSTARLVDGHRVLHMYVVKPFAALDSPERLTLKYTSSLQLQII